MVKNKTLEGGQRGYIPENVFPFTEVLLKVFLLK